MNVNDEVVKIMEKQHEFDVDVTIEADQSCEAPPEDVAKSNCSTPEEASADDSNGQDNPALELEEK